MAFSLLRTLFEDITGNKPASSPAPKLYTQAHKPATPSLAQFTQAMINTKPQELPQDNLDGTYSNLKPDTGAVVTPSNWYAPLKRGVTVAPGMPYYTPLSNSASEYTDGNYYRIPINPDAIPKPLPLLKQMLPGSNY